ncbi:hypothetical protein CEXT_270591 [Caerostris extrusa]|uniref:Uncharacterized protein n=1 Tax=Caerostris extrusa TaxID=172846 RepID=A0AAV4SDN2_CAEEX|nr:hypothetical protein CEXT_270591 [Caerostris extrusa]
MGGRDSPTNIGKNTKFGPQDNHRLLFAPKRPPPNECPTPDEILMNGSLCCQTEYFPEMNVAKRLQSRLREIANNKCPGIVSDYIMYCMCTCESIKRLGSLMIHYTQ